ncbi:MAG: MarR family transcriptional regulator [Rhodobacteraceae bacterium]|nr:MarR family transcriptional regulator [Paracoccaceae bacterium]
MFFTFLGMEVNAKNPSIPLPARFGVQMGIASQLYSGLMHRLLEPHGLTYGQFTVLLHLLRRQSPTRLTSICNAVELNQPAVTKVIQKFQQLGWITTLPDPQDQRGRLIEISAEGRAQAIRIQQSFGPVFEELMRGWSADEVETLIGSLTVLCSRLDALKSPPR